MFIEKINNNGKAYLRLVHAVRKPNKNGHMVSTKQVLLNIGPLDRFDDGKPEYLSRLRTSFKSANPLIPSLLPFCSKERVMQRFSFELTEGSLDCIGHPKLFSNLLLECILEELGMNTLFSSYKAQSKISFDVYGFAKLLLFGRFLHPASKSATVKQNEHYYEPILKEHNPDNVFDTLDFIFEHKDQLIRRINTNLVKKAQRSCEVIYYDVTNFYFEVDEPDEDLLDVCGLPIQKGLRKMGVCKEERKLPIVQMGLFMDNNGIPIAIESFPGNTLDHLTLRSALKRHIDDLELSRFLFVADRGICNYKNLLCVLERGNGYVVSKSLLKSTREERRWIYEEDGYLFVSEEFQYKSRIVKRSQRDEYGHLHTFEEKVVVYWSKKFQAKSERENASFLHFLKKLQESPENFRITSLQSKSIRKFLKKEYVNSKTGEVLHSRDLLTQIDFEKIEEYKKSMGYYQIVTSELLMDPLEVIKTYHGLTQIEDQFRVMKSTLDTRPIYVRTAEHIQAHLLICMIALVMIRVIQKRLCDAYDFPKEKEVAWGNLLSADRIQEALNKWKVEELSNGLYRFLDIDDPDLKLILDAFKLEIPLKLYRKSELKALKKEMKIFM